MNIEKIQYEALKASINYLTFSGGSQFVWGKMQFADNMYVCFTVDNAAIYCIPENIWSVKAPKRCEKETKIFTPYFDVVGTVIAEQKELRSYQQGRNYIVHYVADSDPTKEVWLDIKKLKKFGSLDDIIVRVYDPYHPAIIFGRNSGNLLGALLPVRVDKAVE